ncbi:MAG TPA: PLP-dependent aminotransferase family protein [Dehalococcoidia bacterium]|nr:PLP-dependent aminotransferase family protein [Dehalococcoidia bacterium]
MTIGEGVSTAIPGGLWQATAASEIVSGWTKELMAAYGGRELYDAPDSIVFGAGYPDLPSQPLAGLAAAARAALEKDGSLALQYDDKRGNLLLRGWLAERLRAQEGMAAGPENFFLTCGSNQAIQLIPTVFLNPGDGALVERPTYGGALDVMRSCGAALAGVEMDDGGAIPASLEQAIERLTGTGHPPRLFYTQPTMHNPTGLTAPLERREAIAAICDRHRVLIMEDDAYGEIRVEGERLPSYFTLTGGHGVLRLSTISKMLATGLRVGWVTGRADLIAVLHALPAEGNISPLITRMVAEFCLSGGQDAHLQRVIPLYRERRDRLLAALAQQCTPYATWTRPEGGFFLWLTLAPGIDGVRLNAALRREHVEARRGGPYYLDREDGLHLRLSYSMLAVPEIEEGVRRLGRALAASMRS